MVIIMYERVIEFKDFTENPNDALAQTIDDEPCIIMKDNKPSYTILTYSIYEKLITTVKIFNEDYLEKTPAE